MYLVRCRNAAGTAREIRVSDVRNEERACAVALKFLNRAHPDEGWVAEVVL